MTEGEWLASTDTAKMLAWRQDLGRQSLLGVPTYTAASNRKLRLFACACCRSVWHLLTDTRSRRAVETAERFADGEDGCSHSMDREWTDAWAVVGGPETQNLRTNERMPARACGWLTSTHPNVEMCNLVVKDTVGDLVAAALLRSIVGNPFAPVTLDDTWLTTTVVSLAEAAYQERAVDVCKSCWGNGWHIIDNDEKCKCRSCNGEGVIQTGQFNPDRLGILADAIEDAGCTNATIIEHLRGPDPHYRGDWCIDLLTGRN